jgi:DNA-binding PadR family transcriptional regulator
MLEVNPMSPRRPAELTIEHVLLALLDRKPMHGYELHQELCALKGISLVWNIKQPLLYALLDKLEGKGLLRAQQIHGETYPPRKYFHLTEIGRSSLQAWLKMPVRRARELRQEFLAKLIVARWYGKPAALELIHTQEQACQTWRDELNVCIQVQDRDQVDEWIVYSYRLNRVEAVLQWLKTCELEIDQLPAP